MGQRGPKPLPSNVHLLHGNPSKKTKFELLDDFRPEVEIPDYPSWLYPEAKKEWKRITAFLDKHGLISRGDRAALVLYVQAWAEYATASKRLAQEVKRCEALRLAAEKTGEEYKGGDGFTIPTASGASIYSPHWVIKNKAADQVDKFLANFGLSPSARSKVSVSNNRQAALFDEQGPGSWDSM